MNTFTAATLAALALSLAACGSGGDAKTEASPAPQAVTLQAQPAIAEGVEALPRLVGTTPAIQAINADLARLDTLARAGGCEGGGGFERGILQPMTGPGYVTFWVSENYFCEGSAHPSFDQTVVTYDLATGQAVDWVAAAPGLQLTKGEDGSLSSNALTALYSRKMLASADPERLRDCGDVWTAESLGDTSFKVWLDAENGGMSISPNFPNVILACGDSATLTGADMTEFGVAPAVIEAVAAAHAAGNWAPKA